MKKPQPYKDEEIYSILEEPVKQWFKEKYKTFTPPQRYAIMEIHKRNNVLISSPTGSGKTLAAFLAIINELIKLSHKGKLENRVYAIYVSPLRSLNNDVKKNLETPLKEIKEKAKELNYYIGDIRIAVRTSDTKESEKAKMLKQPPHILITTPESLAIILSTKKFREHIKKVEFVVVDEIHALAESKRGTHLALSLERLNYLTNFVRIGLSATIHPLEEVAKFLFGYENGKPREGYIIDVSFEKPIEIQVYSPVDDIIYSSQEELMRNLYKFIGEQLKKYRTILIFTNTRHGAESVAYHLKKAFPDLEKYIAVHHSSLSREERLEIEEKLKRGELRIVCTSTSLELGIDIGTIDLVIQIGSPKSVNRALQRIGRAGHRLDEKSKGILIGLDRDELLENTIIKYSADNRRLDRIHIPTNALDVLAQHIVGMGLEKEWDLKEAYNLIRNAYPYRNLSWDDYINTIKYLAGEYTKLEHKKVYAKIILRDNKFKTKGSVRAIYFMNIGTIPEETKIAVYTLDNKRIGYVEEEFVEKLVKGDIFVLAGKTYEFLYSKGNKIYVRPVKGVNPTIPHWFSEMLPLSYDLAIEIQKFREEIAKKLEREPLD
ncbi:NEQ003 [Nanoarchaeum equitans Kin4-M]|uniref:NEQ003 n=1 Tax=Nanoarchaeum equitans (strain Kin4-M) TaxID=228908 RepID=Q74N37_NANEQ|nr:NEQ003 [Nanoarchaeum equitans Kin4-M]